MRTNRETRVKLDVLIVREDELLLNSLSLKVNTTLKATVILFLLPFTTVFNPHLMRSLLHYIVFF